jgi:hypothetical protein
MSKAIDDVVAERKRQIDVEGWTQDHDDATHLPGVLALAACCYCTADEGDAPPVVWPWALKWWKPKDSRRNKVRAAALLIAEIERIDRGDAKVVSESSSEDKEERYDCPIHGKQDSTDCVRC